MKTNNLPETECKTLILKILKELSGNFNEELVIIKEKHRNNNNNNKTSQK